MPTAQTYPIWFQENIDFLDGCPDDYLLRLIGVVSYSKWWYDRNRRYLPAQRINLQTEILEEGHSNRTDEEMYAYLDYEAQKQQKIDQQVENELVAAGGFCQSRERGIRGLWKQLNAGTHADVAQFIFMGKD